MARSGQSRLFLELFAGCAELTRALRRCGEGALALDITRGEHHDVLFLDVYYELRSWIRSGAIHGLWLGTPCESLSRARPCALRSLSCIRGLPNLSARDREEVALSNRLADRSGQLATLAYETGIRGGEENPASSYLWDFESRKRFARLPSARAVVVDFCAFGTPFRARTKLAFWHMLPPQALAAAHCVGRGTCSFSRKPHVQLTNTSAGFKARAKNAYPRGMCSVIAREFSVARKRGEAAGRWKQISGLNRPDQYTAC